MPFIPHTFIPYGPFSVRTNGRKLAVYTADGTASTPMCGPAALHNASPICHDPATLTAAPWAAPGPSHIFTRTCGICHTANLQGRAPSGLGVLRCSQPFCNDHAGSRPHVAANSKSMAMFHPVAAVGMHSIAHFILGILGILGKGTSRDACLHCEVMVA